MFVITSDTKVEKSIQPLWEYKDQGNTKTMNQDEWFLSLKNGLLAQSAAKGAEERRRLMAGV